MLRRDYATMIEIPKGAANVMFMESCLCGCNGGACIPQREYYQRPNSNPLSQDELQEKIFFRVNGVCGYPLVDALKKQHPGLDGGDDKMSMNGKSSITLRLEVRSFAPTQSRL